MSHIHLHSVRVREWGSLLVNLSNNPLTLAGVALTTTAGVFWLFLLPVFLKGDVGNPYHGILLFLILPGAFFGGLCLMPAGIWLRLRRMKKRGELRESLPPVDVRNPSLRRLVTLFLLTTCANLLIGSQLSYRAVTYMDSVTFCGQTCHTVMVPEFTAYQNSAHSRVHCVECHIGEGASWFVKSKLSGVWQVFAVTFDTFERPIPTPVHDLRPARDTCENCHWPQKFGADHLRMLPHFADDEQNTPSKTVLLMRIGGAGIGPGIHGAHLGEGVEIRYRHADEKRQTIPWVESSRPGAKTEEFLGENGKKEAIEKMPLRVMDCMDCHTRPSHAFELPDGALNQALAAGQIPAKLPFIKKKGSELLQAKYPSRAEAEVAIPRKLREFYQRSYPETFESRGAEVDRAARALLAIYQRNVFPDMKIDWGTYPNHIGHNDFPGCFRCHDGRTSASGKTLTQDCNACHQLLAMEEPDPKVLKDLGLVPTNGN